MEKYNYIRQTVCPHIQKLHRFSTRAISSQRKGGKMSLDSKKHVTFISYTRCLTLSEGLVNRVATLSQGLNTVTRPICHSLRSIFMQNHVEIKPQTTEKPPAWGWLPWKHGGCHGNGPRKYYPKTPRPLLRTTSTINWKCSCEKVFWLLWQLLSR